MDIGRVKWRKSSYSANNGGACVEVCTSDQAAVAVRDSKDREGPALGFTPGAWSVFVQGIKNREFDLA
jgi:Domain of unknown function (DUF397)